MADLVQGIRYGLMAVGWLLSVGVGIIALCTLGAMLTALGDWLNGLGGEAEGEDGNDD